MLKEHKRYGHPTAEQQSILNARNRALVRRWLKGEQQNELAAEVKITPQGFNKIIQRIAFNLLGDERIKIMTNKQIKIEFGKQLAEKLCD